MALHLNRQQSLSLTGDEHHLRHIEWQIAAGIFAARREVLSFRECMLRIPFCRRVFYPHRLEVGLLLAQVPTTWVEARSAVQLILDAMGEQADNRQHLTALWRSIESHNWQQAEDRLERAMPITLNDPAFLILWAVVLMAPGRHNDADRVTQVLERGRFRYPPAYLRMLAGTWRPDQEQEDTARTA